MVNNFALANTTLFQCNDALLWLPMGSADSHLETEITLAAIWNTDLQ